MKNVLILLFLLVFGLYSANGQVKNTRKKKTAPISKKKTSPKTRTPEDIKKISNAGTLIIKFDKDCIVEIDKKSYGVLRKGQEKEYQLLEGEHLVEVFLISGEIVYKQIAKINRNSRNILSVISAIPQNPLVQSKDTSSDEILDRSKTKLELNTEKEYRKTGKEENKAFKEEKTANQGVFVDFRDRQKYKWVRLPDGKKWMIENLNYMHGSSWCYNDEDKYCKRFGYLYTWHSAKGACPDGWRLPTEADWGNMIKYFGEKPDIEIIDKDRLRYEAIAKLARKKQYVALIEGGQSGFEALLGGERRSSKFYDMNRYGFYWSASLPDDYSGDYGYAINYYFDKEDGELKYEESEQINAYSCRCIQD